MNHMTLLEKLHKDHCSFPCMKIIVLFPVQRSLIFFLHKDFVLFLVQRSLLSSPHKDHCSFRSPLEALIVVIMPLEATIVMHVIVVLWFHCQICSSKVRFICYCVWGFHSYARMSPLEALLVIIMPLEITIVIRIIVTLWFCCQIHSSKARLIHCCIWGLNDVAMKKIDAIAL